MFIERSVGDPTAGESETKMKERQRGEFCLILSGGSNSDGADLLDEPTLREA